MSFVSFKENNFHVRVNAALILTEQKGTIFQGISRDLKWAINIPKLKRSTTTYYEIYCYCYFMSFFSFMLILNCHYYCYYYYLLIYFLKNLLDVLTIFLVLALVIV